MADKNFNQGQQSHQSNQDWDKERNRYNQDNEWSYQQQSSQQNRGSNQGYRDVGYSGDSARGMGQGNQGNIGRANYIPDNDDNRDYGSSQYGSSGSFGYQSGGMDYNPGGYRNENRGSGSYGNMSNEYNSSDWNRRSGYGGSYGNQYNNNEGDRDRRNWQQSSGSNWGNDYGRQDWNRGSGNQGYDSGRDYGNRNYGGGFGNMSNDYGRSDWDRNRSRYDRDDRDWGRRDRDNDNWWEKTKDKVSSWFSDDDNDDRRRREYGSHRGKGPSDYRRSEDRIREDICDRLTDDDRVDASNIRVQIENDAVVLSGTVNSREEKRRAEDLVESISGVRNVENRLRVGGGTMGSHEYTGNTSNTGGIGNESGTTNEVIRNVSNDRTSGTERGRTKTQ